MIYGIAKALDPTDSRVLPLTETADRHAEAGFAAVQRDMDYAGSHWLGTPPPPKKVIIRRVTVCLSFAGSFAVYLGTCRGQQ